jgi:hypothetical protein
MTRSSIPTEPNASQSEPVHKNMVPSEPMCNLHMLVPVAARRHAKLAAVASGLPFREFVARLLFSAQPLSANSPESCTQDASPTVTGHMVVHPIQHPARDTGAHTVGTHSDACGDNDAPTPHHQ